MSSRSTKTRWSRRLRLHVRPLGAPASAATDPLRIIPDPLLTLMLTTVTHFEDLTPDSDDSYTL